MNMEKNSFIKIALDVWPRWLDPFLTMDFSDRCILNLLHEPLVSSKKSCQITLLSASTYKVRIKDNLFWSNGERVTSEDYAQQFYRYKNFLKKLQPNSQRLSAHLPIQSIKVVSKKDLQIQTKIKNTRLLKNMLNMPFFTPFPRWINVETYDPLLSPYPFFSGPFMIDEFTDTSLRLVPNPYHDEIQALKTPICGVEFVFTKNREDTLKKLRSNKLNITCSSQFGFKKNDFKGLKTVEKKLPLTGFIFLNPNRKPFLKVDDRRTILEGIENIKRNSTLICHPCASLIDDFIPSYYSESLFYTKKVFVRKLTSFGKNQRRGTPLKFELIYSDDFPNKQILEILSTRLKKYELFMRPKELSYRKFIDHILVNDYSACFSIVASPHSHFFGILRQFALQVSDSILSKTYRALIEKYETTNSDNEGKKIITTMKDILWRDVCVIPVCEFTSLIGITPMVNHGLIQLLKNRGFL